METERDDGERHRREREQLVDRHLQLRQARASQYDAAYEFEKKVVSDRRIVVGVNAFVEGNAADELEILRITAEHEEAQIDRLRAVKAGRNDDAVRAGLAALERDARDPEVNLMPVLLDAVRAYATEGEIMDALASVFGRYVETPRL